MTETTIQENDTAPPVVTSEETEGSFTKAENASKKAAPMHPSTAIMVNSAIMNLNERGGSSLQAIKKYIRSTYKVDSDRINPFIKKYVKSAANSGALIRTKGKGANGSFKLPAVKPKSKNKPTTEKNPKPTATKAELKKKPITEMKPKAATMKSESKKKPKIEMKRKSNATKAESKKNPSTEMKRQADATKAESKKNPSTEMKRQADATKAESKKKSTTEIKSKVTTTKSESMNPKGANKYNKTPAVKPTVRAAPKYLDKAVRKKSVSKAMNTTKKAPTVKKPVSKSKKIAVEK